MTLGAIDVERSIESPLLIVTERIFLREEALTGLSKNRRQVFLAVFILISIPFMPMST